MAKYLVIDTETTGLDPTRNQMIQLGAVVYDNDKVQCKLNCEINFRGEGIIDPAAFVKNNNSINYFMNSSASHREKDAVYQLCDFVKKNPCDYLVGFNVQFDLAFLRAAFERAKVNFVNFLPYKVIDPFVIVQALQLAGAVPSTIKTNLAALCHHYRVEANPTHEALADIEATYQLARVMISNLGGNNNGR
jgi:DNA polymerase-3 subunit epsilon